MINYEDLSKEELIERIKELANLVEEQSEKIVELNLYDDQLGYFNKKALYMLLEYEINRMNRLPAFLSVTLIAVNNIEKISEKYGEEIRDVLLLQIANNIKGIVRISDIIGLYEDGIFMIISPDINPNKGVIIAERIQSSIEKDEYPLGIKVTTSGGVKHHEGEPANKLMNIVEGNLRLSKKEGRNKLVSSL